MFDRVPCSFDMAGVLMKNGLLSPSSFFEGWYSVGPGEKAKPYVCGLREVEGAKHAYENVAWLAAKEAEYRARTSAKGLWKKSARTA